MAVPSPISARTSSRSRKTERRIRSCSSSTSRPHRAPMPRPPSGRSRRRSPPIKDPRPATSTRSPSTKPTPPLHGIPPPACPITAEVRRVIRELTAVRGTAEQTGGALDALAPMRTYEAYEIVRGNQQVLDRLTNTVSENLLGDTRSSSRVRLSAAQLLDDPAENRRVLLEDARSMVARADGESRRTLVSLADIVRTLRNVDGRKAVILFSEGFQVDHVTHELEDVAAAAAQSYCVIYAMDLNSRAVEAIDRTARGAEQATETLDRLQSLGAPTAATSGTLVNDASNHPDRAPASIAETTEDYYLVGFAPA